jgi:N-dimethylarginine dimethylaminohydrolase
LFYDNKIILSHFKFKQRQGEIPHFKRWFTQAGFELISSTAPKSPYFEGAGDALLAGNNLFVGYGFRSEYKFYEQASFLNPAKLTYCELSNPYFYHLDTCFCPLNEELAIWYPPAFTKESQKRISEKIQLIPVVEDEARYFACNAIVIGNQVVLPSKCPQVSATLEKHNFIVHSCDMSEYIKAGGACKCLTLRID